MGSLRRRCHRGKKGDQLNVNKTGARKRARQPRIRISPDLSFASAMKPRRRPSSGKTKLRAALFLRRAARRGGVSDEAWPGLHVEQRTGVVGELASHVTTLAATTRSRCESIDGHGIPDCRHMAEHRANRPSTTPTSSASEYAQRRGTSGVSFNDLLRHFVGRDGPAPRQPRRRGADASSDQRGTLAARLREMVGSENGHLWSGCCTKSCAEGNPLGGNLSRPGSKPALVGGSSLRSKLEMGAWIGVDLKASRARSAMGLDECFVTGAATRRWQELLRAYGRTSWHTFAGSWNTEFQNTIARRPVSMSLSLEAVQVSPAFLWAERTPGTLQRQLHAPNETRYKPDLRPDQTRERRNQHGLVVGTGLER
ncbi:unnamed protein product [Diplocarpon coronariae]